MIWGTLALFVVSFLLTALLAPKPKIENARASSLDDLQFPRASEGSPVSLLLGRDRVRSPNTLWYGGFRTVPVTETVKTGLFSSKTQIIGYKYYVTIDLGLCLGPNVRLRKIWSDKDEIWSGNIGPSETAINIDEPGLYGGDKKGGGFSGTLRFYGGSNSQNANSHIAGLIGDVYPAYVGHAHIVFEDCYIGTAAQLRPFSFECERTSNGLGFSGGMEQVGDDMNPAELVFQLMTLDWGGLGLDTSELNIASMLAAGATLYNEGNGMSLSVTSANTGEDLIGEVLRQTDGIFYQDPTTAEIVMDLIRQDYDVDDLPVFDDTMVKEVRDFSRTSWEDTLNQVRVTYNDRSNKYETGSAIQQDMANINAQGRLRSTNVSFPGVRVGELANDLAAREMAQLSIPLYKTTLELNRKAGTLRPGDPFIFSWPEYGIAQVVMRVQRFNFGELIDGRVVIEAVQDEFASSATVFVAPEPTEWDPVSRTPEEITAPLLIEAPYFIASRVDPTILTQPSAGETLIMAFARRPSASQLGYSALASQDDFANTFSAVDGQLYSRTAVLQTAVTAADGYADGELASITVDQLAPSTDFLEDATAAEARGGANLFILNGELMTFLDATDNMDGTWTLATVKRALLDTAPQAHAVDDILYFIDGIDALGLTALDGDGDPIDARFLSFTDKGEYPFDDADDVTVTPDRRYERPLPPDYVTIAGEARGASVTVTSVSGGVEVTWRRRDRDADLIAFEDDPDDDGAGNTVTLRIYNADTDALLYEYTGLTGTSYNVPELDAGTLSNTYFTLTAVDGGTGLESFEVSRVQALFTLSGYGNDYGNHYGN